VSKKWDQKKFKLRIFVRDITYPVAAIILVVCIIAVFFGTLATFFVDNKQYKTPEPFFSPAKKINEQNLDICILGLGVLALLFAGWYFGDGYYKRRRFEKLMDTDSKARFLEDLDEIEELAYKLSSYHEELVYERKRELKIKRK
jgi:hypothetical protein